MSSAPPAQAGSSARVAEEGRDPVLVLQHRQLGVVAEPRHRLLVVVGQERHVVPRLASIASLWWSMRWAMNSLAASRFFPNFQIAHTPGSATFQTRPLGPATSGTT